MEQAVDHPADRQVLLKSDELLAFQIPERDPLTPGQRVRGVADEHQLVPAEVLDDQSGLLGRKRHEPEVSVPFEHVRVHLRGTAVVHDDLHLGVGSLELFQKGRQFMQADVVHGGDPQFPRHHVLQLADAVAEALEGVQNFPAGLEKGFPFLRDGEVLFASFDQADVEMLLQRADLLADRTLGDGVQRGGLREAGGLNEVAEDLEGFNLHPLKIHLKEN